MNAIQQISLKLQLGIDLDADIAPSVLRALWNSRVDADHRRAVAARAGRTPAFEPPSGQSQRH